jgi:hypothetical protein
MSKCLVLFVEGETEVEFYKAVISDARQRRVNGRFDINIETRNVKGVGGFKSIALRKFLKEIKPRYEPDTEFVVALCRDTDVFELSSKPPVKWEEVEKEFRENGAEVIHVKARHSIEDWFLEDVNGIISFLRLPKKTKISGSNGYDKLKKLYRQANKMYIKGMKSNGMIQHLDIPVIVNSVKGQLQPLYEILGVELK